MRKWQRTVKCCVTGAKLISQAPGIKSRPVVLHTVLYRKGNRKNPVSMLLYVLSRVISNVPWNKI